MYSIALPKRGTVCVKVADGIFLQVICAHRCAAAIQRTHLCLCCAPAYETAHER